MDNAKFYCITTYGCQMNIHESEKIAGILESRGYLPTAEQADADIIVFNTCCIRAGAENRAMGNIGAVKKLKKAKPELVTVICGCMPQQPAKEKALHVKFPFVDIILGTHNIAALGEYLDELARSRYVGRIVEDDDRKTDLTPMRRDSGLNAWVNISYGCNNFCTYCIVPYVRGRERSRGMDEIEREVVQAVRAGYREVTLLGQNVNSYGNDARDDGVCFAALLDRLARIEGDFRIKYMTSHPKDFGRDIVEAMAANPRVANYVHLPVQSGSTAILAAMNRRYTREEYLAKVAYLRERIPDAGLSTDVMVGFPGETEEDFEATMDLVERVRFDNMFMFVYSRRSGTVADRMENQIPMSVKTQRINRLVAAHRRIAAEVARECVGKTYRALAECRDGKMIATTDCGRFVTLEGADERLHGRFCEVEIIASHASKLRGRVTE